MQKRTDFLQKIICSLLSISLKFLLKLKLFSCLFTFFFLCSQVLFNQIFSLTFAPGSFTENVVKKYHARHVKSANEIRSDNSRVFRLIKRSTPGTLDIDGTYAHLVFHSAWRREVQMHIHSTRVSGYTFFGHDPFVFLQVLARGRNQASQVNACMQVKNLFRVFRCKSKSHFLRRINSPMQLLI